MSVFEQAIGQFSHYQKSESHYLDNAATTQKPDSVIDAVTCGYRQFCAPVHRASYPAGEAASVAYERARSAVAGYIGASAEQLIFTKSATESINQVALGWARSRIQPHHRIWVSRMEHNANYLPWYLLCQEVGAELRIIEMDSQGQLLLENEEIWQESSLLIALTHCSNVLGGKNPVEQVCTKARQHNICVLVDAAQSVSHTDINVAAMGCDFLAFSAHKMYGPEGIGGLYISPARQAELSPVLMGGGIVVSAGSSGFVLRETPYCYEAGSPNLSGALGFEAAVGFLEGFEAGAVGAYIDGLSLRLRDRLSREPGVTLLPVAGGGPCGSVTAFVVDGVHPHDVAHMAAENHVAIRTGHHCCHLLMEKLQVGAVNRVSLAVYNSERDFEPLISAIQQSQRQFSLNPDRARV